MPITEYTATALQTKHIDDSTAHPRDGFSPLEHTALDLIEWVDQQFPEDETITSARFRRTLLPSFLDPFEIHADADFYPHDVSGDGTVLRNVWSVRLFLPNGFEIPETEPTSDWAHTSMCVQVDFVKNASHPQADKDGVLVINVGLEFWDDKEGIHELTTQVEADRTSDTVEFFANGLARVKEIMPYYESVPQKK
jgi:hypothetical protein